MYSRVLNDKHKAFTTACGSTPPATARPRTGPCRYPTAMAASSSPAGGFEVKGRFELVSGKKDVWAHPVILAGRLYLRYAAKLYCHDIRR